MRFKHIAAIAWLAAVLSPKPLAAEVKTSVTFFGKALVNASSVGFPDAIKVLTIQDFNDDAGTEPKMEFYNGGATASSVHGTAEIQINGYGEVHWFETFFGDPNAGKLHANLHATLIANIPAAGPEGYVQSARAELMNTRVIVDWTDPVTIGTSKAPPGTPIIVSNNFQLTGALTPAVSGDNIPFKTAGFAESWVLLQGQPYSHLPTPVYNQYYGYARDNGPNNDGLKFDPPVSIPYTFQAFTGQAYDLGLSLEVGGNGLAAAEGFLRTPASVLSVVSADFTKTLTWGGITGVTNAITGEPIDDWTISSESGFDYARSYIVPEPIGITLYIVGALGCAAHLRSITATAARVANARRRR